MDQVKSAFLDQEVNFHEFVFVLQKRKWFIIAFTCVLCTFVIIRAFVMKPVYSTSVKLLIQKQAPHVVKLDEVTSTGYSGMEYYQTQYNILRSRFIAESVYGALGEYSPWDPWRGRSEKVSARFNTPFSKTEFLMSVTKIVPIPNTEIVEIRTEDIDPVLAARIAGLWAEKYIGYILDTKVDVTEYASDWLRDKIEKAQKDLEVAENVLQNYRKESSILTGEALTGTKTVLDQLLEKKANLDIELSEELEYFKEKHPKIIALRSELESVEGKIVRETAKELEDKDKEIKFNMLKRNVDTANGVYASLLKRMSETELAGALKTTNVSVIEKAVVPKKPVRPRKQRDIAIALVGGLVLSSVISLIIEGLDQSLRTPDAVKRYLGLPCLAAIPYPRVVEDKVMDPELISWKSPRSTISESYRELRTSLLFASVEHKKRSIVFTSASPEEGKTTSAVNLAAVMAQAGEKTILVDADMRKPRIAQVFGLESSRAGLSECLIDKVSLEAATAKTEIENLSVITSGAIPPNPSELLGSTRMEVLLKKLLELYDAVIIDAPPALAVTDAVVLAGRVDGVILVIQYGKVHRNAVIRARDILAPSNSSKIIGVVLNKVEMTKPGSYYNTYYYGTHPEHDPKIAG
ncbi:MAG: polysaccharide biosynthesis tyrosine autokinase [Candidatus Omnitrophica bacterium]|nr:polysaccharide biosynthesis tyrosine autokinase [Candidatus Omnitrophota bacterium]